MKSIYKVYRDRLVEITGKSRSLYSKNATSKQSYNLGKLFAANNEEATDFVNFLFGSNQSRYRVLTDRHIDTYIKDLKVEKPTAVQRQKYAELEQKKFVQLKREIEEIQRDTGKYELFVGYPFVEGVINKNIAVKAPLLLFPAKLSIEKDVDIVLLKDEPVQLNKVFLLAYFREMKLKTNDMLMEFENFGENFSSITAVKDFLEKQGVKLKYTPTKKPITDIEVSRDNEGELELRHHCVIGRFPLANSIYYDYNELFRKKLSNTALEVLLNSKPIKIKDKKISDEYHTTHSLDFAQSMAVEKCDKQKHLVIYGPPGTGKSQTIASMIIDNICKNKRALVVSQKRSALDVVYNRLGPVNSKAVLLPDPEKNKNEFYAKVRARFDEIQNYKQTFDETAYRKYCAMLDNEVAELHTISDSLFTVTPFGLTLQQMYSMSGNIARNSADYAIYTAMQKSDIMKMNYRELADVCASIEQRNKGKLFYDHISLSNKNPLIDYIKTDLDMHTLNQVKTFLRKLISKDYVPFNIAGYTYSRYMLVYNLEHHNNTSLKPLSEMIVKSENPNLYSTLRLTYIPLLWPALPFVKYKYHKKRKAIENKLLTAENAVKRFVNEFELLRSVLESEGLAMVIDSIAYGNDKFPKELLATLEDYVSVREMKLAMNSITESEKKIISFAIQNSKNLNEFHVVLRKILQIRIYHEVVEHERKKEQILSKTIIYEDLRKRIAELINQQRVFSGQLANDSFFLEAKQLFEQDAEKTKNFLHQINKQRGLWPVRRLVEHFENYLLTIFPCWLLSPESVSQVLPLKDGLFDVVLFDEASQLFIESTIPAVYRGKSLVVAGDNKQLRPTSVFVKRYMGDDTTYDESTSLSAQALLEVESLLDLASSRLNASHLTYHYRSHHEELINFSNYAFYGGNLQIAPNISKNKGFLAIERIKVNGRWQGRHNHEEAKEIVKIVKNIFRTRKNNESIGIVTFNTEQEEYIKDLLDKEALASPQFKKDYLNEIARTEKGEDTSLFVKNLENVQGDERDIIIFSIAYARNDEGKLSTHFGSLSMSGGENRLNVAITRAVRKVYVVTSVEPEEFVNISESKNDGPKLLIKYLQYARAVSERKEDDVKRILESLSTTAKTGKEKEYANEFVGTLKKEIEKLGYIVETDLGNAEYKISLAVYDESLDRYLLGIECDNTAYASSTSMMERDVYRIGFLNSRGWDIMRVWSRDWWLGKNSLIKQIENRINLNKKSLMEKLGIAQTKKNIQSKKQTSETEQKQSPAIMEIAADTSRKIQSKQQKNPAPNSQKQTKEFATQKKDEVMSSKTNQRDTKTIADSKAKQGKSKNTLTEGKAKTNSK